LLTRRDQAGAKPSLRSRLARHVLLPLALTWGLGSIVALTVAEHFAAEAFDRALLDSLLDLAATGCAQLTDLQQAALAAST